MTELILGAGGMLARGLARERPDARSLGIGDLDITDPRPSRGPSSRA